MSIVVSAAIDSRGAEVGAQRFNRALATMRTGVAQTGQSLGGLGALLRSGPVMVAGFAAALGLLAKKSLDAADSFTLLKARLTLAAEAGQPVGELMGKLVAAAERARVPVSELGALFARNATVFKEMKRPQSENLELTELLAKATKIAGATSTEAASAMHQLSQALAKGVLNGDEFNSVAENMPTLLQEIRSQTGKTVGQLRQLAEDGQISSDLIINAILNAKDKINKDFASIPKTVGETARLATDALAREWSNLADRSGVTKAWVEFIENIRQAIADPAVQGAMKVFADSLSATGTAFKDLLKWIRDTRIEVQAWSAAISETKLYKEFADALRLIKDGFVAIWEFVGGPQFMALMTDAKNKIFSIDPEFAERIKQYREELQKVANVAASAGGGGLVGTVRPDANPWTATVRRPVAFKKGQLETSLEAERLAAELRAAEFDAFDPDTDLRVQALRNELDIRKKITDEQRKADPLIAAQYEALLRSNNEFERQSAIMKRNRELGESFARVLTDGIRDAVAQGKNLGDTFKQVLSRMLDMVTQALILEPLVKSIGRSFSQAMGGTDVGGLFGRALGQLFGAGAGDVGLGSWGGTVVPFAKGGVVDGPTAFAGGGLRGVMGEAGPEAIMPLTRGPDGRLGVAASGGGGQQVVVNFHVNGNPDKTALAEMERLAQRVFAQHAPVVVRAAVNGVADAHRRDPNYLRR